MKILASDFDNTIYISDKKKFQKNIEFIHHFKEKQNLFIIITGRQYSDILPLLKMYNIPYDYLICGDGASVYNEENQLIKEILLDIEEINKIIKYAKQLELPFFLDDGKSFGSSKDKCVKVAIPLSNSEKNKKMIDYLNKLDLHVYLSENWINITDKNANKYDAIKWILSYLKTDEDSIYCIGDGINDKEMLKQFNGVLVSDHHESLAGLNLKKHDHFYQYIEELVKD